MPRTQNNLWNKIISFENLYKAFKKARKNKRFKDEVLAFTFKLEENLIIIQNELIWKTWKPGKWREFMVYDPKPRIIHAPPFRDRVVHHALCMVLTPLFERKFIFDSYACREGRGTHAAMYRTLHFLRKAKRNFPTLYILKADIKQYFPSIDHERLKKNIRRTVRCHDTLWLIDLIIDHGGENGKGLPIGALTSQLFANVYLDLFDHYVKDELGIKHYVRYMDDFVIIHHDKKYLYALKEQIEEFLFQKLSLTLNPKTQIFPYKNGIDFCGYRIWPTHVLPRKRNVRRAKKRLKRLAQLYKENKISLDKFKASLYSFLGYMRHCNGFTTLRGILKEIALKREL